MLYSLGWESRGEEGGGRQQDGERRRRGKGNRVKGEGTMYRVETSKGKEGKGGGVIWEARKGGGMGGGYVGVKSM